MTGFLIDYQIVCTLLLLIACLGRRCFREPTRRLVLARIVLLLLIGSAILLLMPNRPRISLRRPISQPLASQNVPVHRVWQNADVASLELDRHEQSTVSEPVRQLTPHPTVPTPYSLQIQSNKSDAVISRQTVTGPVDVVPSQTESMAKEQPRLSFNPVALIYGIWFTGMGLIGIWLALGAVHLRRLLRHAQNAPEEMTAVFVRMTRHARHTRRIRVSISPKIAAPIVTGIVWPTILIPESLWKEKRKTRDKGLRFALAHEWAHIHNGDLWFLAITRLLAIVLFPNPLFWWLGRRMREDQELLADAHAAAMTLEQDVKHLEKHPKERENRRLYALELVRWSRRAKAVPSIIHATGLTLAIGEIPVSRRKTHRRNKSFTRRIDMLLDAQQLELNTPRRWKLLATVLLGTAMIAFSLVTLQPQEIIVADETAAIKAHSVSKEQETATGNEIKAGMERSAMTGSTQQPSHFSKQHINELLEEPFACNFGTEVPLRTVLDHIQKKIAFPILIDTNAVKVLEESQEITVHAQLPFQLPLKNVLDYLVRQHDLAWHVRDNEMILITDKRFISEYAYKAYYVGDLTATPPSPDKDLYASHLSTNFDAIAEYLRTMVAPESWKEEMATIRPYSNTLTLIIRQTEQNHQLISELLRNLRKTNDVQINIEIQICPDDATDYKHSPRITFINGQEFPLEPDWRRGECVVIITPNSMKPVRDDLARQNEPIQVRWPEGKTITIWGVAGKRNNQDTIKLTVTVEGDEPVTRIFYASPVTQEDVEYPIMELATDSPETTHKFVYDVADLCDPEGNMGDLVSLIKETISPHDWGEMASIEIAGKKLTIVHTSSGHEKIIDLLRQLRNFEPANTYRLAHGDVVAIYIEGNTGTPGQPVPVYQLDPELPPASGYPFTVRDDGTIALPKMLQTLKVEGLTLKQTEALIRRTYVDKLKILDSDKTITVSLIRPRVVRVISAE